jgi:hypothetical protein
MRNQADPDPGWAKIAGVLHHLEQMQTKQDSRAVSAASGQASSPSGSAGNTLKGSGSEDPQERDYVRAVLECYLGLPGTSTVTSRHDRRCAEQLYRRGIPLDVVRSAMVVAVARRTFRRGTPLPRVRAVAYFLPAVEEQLEFRSDPGYVQYLEDKLRPLAAAKAMQGEGRQSSPSS